MIKALYGTRSGGARWYDRLFDILQELNFKHSNADPDVWMRPEPGGTCYEYIAVYVDDLAIAAKDPQAFCNEPKKKYNLKLKGVGPLEYHLGCTYKKDPDGTLAADPRRYVNKILESYERVFKKKPRKARPPLEGGDHPELDTSELCDEHQTKQFQTLIGQLQWLISLGCFDIAVHVMSLARFRAQPRKGHLDRAKRIVGYLLFLPDGAIRFRTGEPDFSPLKDQDYDWTRSVYSGACEQIPHYIPKPQEKHVQTTHYVDANLHHDLATGNDVTAVLHFLNQTPIDAYTKRQSTVETATYGSEFGYVNKILESYERMFKEKPRKSRPPFEGGDHPELDTSELCDEHQTKQFQTLIGQLQWLISLGCFDIAVHVMSLSRFRAQPRKGHLDTFNVTTRHGTAPHTQDYQSEPYHNTKIRLKISLDLPNVTPTLS